MAFWVLKRQYVVPVAYDGHLNYDLREATKREGPSKDQLLLESRGNVEAAKGKAGGFSCRCMYVKTHTPHMSYAMMPTHRWKTCFSCVVLHVLRVMSGSL